MVVETYEPIFKRMTLVDFVSSLGPIQRGSSFILLTAWDRVAFLWFPHPGDNSGVETLIEAGWCDRDILLDVPQMPVEHLRRGRTRAWRLVAEKGCVEVTFHGTPVGILAGIPRAGEGWEPLDVVGALRGEWKPEGVAE